MGDNRCLVVLSLLLIALIGLSSSQINSNRQVLGSCNCDYRSPSSPLVQEDCRTDGVCDVSTPNAAFHACAILHTPRRTDEGRVDVFYSCVGSLISFGAFCNEIGNTVEFPNYTVTVFHENPRDFAVCCYSNNCNTPEVLEEVFAVLNPPTTETPSPPLTLPYEQDFPVPPLYFLVAFPVLTGAVVIIAVVILVICCYHFSVKPRKSKPSGVPTITSQESSSCGDPSLNDLLEYSGSGAGLPLLVQRSIAGQISLHELIGKGRYGEVWKGLYKCDEVAVKIFNTREEASWSHEIDIYKTCLFRHPNILRFIASDNRDIGVQVELWLITEFCEYGSLYDFLIQHTLEPATMLHLAYTAICGLDHLHTEIIGHEAKPAIVHRDLKSRNILVKADYTCCIGDLGLALRYNRVADQVEDPPSKRVGTKRYLAPEIIDEAIMFRHFESFKRADMYSFGLILWEIVMRGEVNGVAEDYQMPYQNLVPADPSFEDMKKAVVTEKLRPTLPNRWTQSELFRGLSKLIQQCWLHESEARLTSPRLKKSLHSLQQSCDSEKKKGGDKDQSS